MWLRKNPMKNTLNLEATLGCPPCETYLGGKYIEDLCQCSDVSFSPEGYLKACLTFLQSGFSQKGFHFSAVQVQRLVPYLCQELLQKILAPQQQIEAFSLLKTEQEFFRYVTASQDIGCSVQLLQQEGDIYHLTYLVL